MKISQLAKTANVPKETIRYYVSLGLLFPERKGKNFEYTEKELKDLNFILKLKSMMFTLKEIQEILSMTKTFYGIEPSYMFDYIEILKKKREEISQDIILYNQSLLAIKDEIKSVEMSSVEASRITGVPVSAMSILACPSCHRMLEIKNANIVNKYILSGKLCCSCGYRANIQNGIIVTKNKCTDVDDHPDVARELYKRLHPDFLKVYQKISNMITEDLSRVDLHKKVVLEANVNGYFYLYNNFRNLPSDALYVVIDKYPEMLAMYKRLLEKLDLNFDILYIADANVEYPIKQNSIDVFVDFFGNSQYQFYSQNSYITDVHHYLRDDSKIFGSYMHLPLKSKSKFNISQKYKNSSFNAYYFPKIQSDYRDLGYDIEEEVIGSVFETSNQFSFVCHETGEEMRIYYYKTSTTT